MSSLPHHHGDDPGRHPRAGAGGGEEQSERPREARSLQVARIEARYQTDVLDKLDFKGIAPPPRAAYATRGAFKEFVSHCQSPASGQYYDTEVDWFPSPIFDFALRRSCWKAIGS
jgi:hypothetical protein